MHELLFIYLFSFFQVDFSFNELGQAGAAVLAKMLPQCNNLHTLRLRGNGFKPEHITKITDAVILNNSIRRIDVGQNIRPGKHVMQVRYTQRKEKKST